MKFSLPRIFSVVAASLALVVAAAPSQAAMISFFDAQTLQAQDFLLSTNQVQNGSQVSANHSGAYALQKFDTALGTLNSVRLQINQGINSSLSLNAFSSSGGSTCNPFDVSGAPCDMGLTRNGNQTATYSAGSAVNAAFASQSFNNSFGCSLGGNAFPGSSFASCIDGAPHNETFALTNDILLTGAQTGDFEGAGNFAVDTDMIFQFFTSAIGSNFLIFTNQAFYNWAGTVTVTYDYTANATEIPAPAGAAFLLIGLAALTRFRGSSAG
jgi:hypothetical protein